MELHFLPDILFSLAAAYLFPAIYKAIAPHKEKIDAAKPVAIEVVKLLGAMDIHIAKYIPQNSMIEVATVAAQDLLDDGEIGRESFNAVANEAIELFQGKFLDKHLQK